MLGKSLGDYSLSEGNRDHYIIFDLGKDYYLKSIRIKVDGYECTIKNFTVSVKEGNGYTFIQKYIRDKYSDNKEFQEFNIEKEGRIFKFDLIDNWGSGGGNYILIKELQFYVGEI